MEAWRPDLVVVDKKRRTCKIIDFASRGDCRIEEKNKEQIEKYQDLRRQLQKIWNVKVKIIPLVVSSLGAIPKQFSNRLKENCITAKIYQQLSHDHTKLAIRLQRNNLLTANANLEQKC